MTRVAEFEIHFRRYLDERADAVADHPLLTDWPRLIGFYRLMATTRRLDQKAVALQRTGQLGTYASCLGAEAIGAGAGSALQPDDVHVPYYRDQAIQLLRGVSMTEILLFWGGDERGSAYGAASAREDLPNCVPIATQLSHAAGVAAAINYRGQQRAVLATCGDGATSRGDFHEALNLAGVWRLPLVVLVNNNQWAISVPRKAQTASQTLAQKGIGAGIACVQLDGNDVVAVFTTVEEALQRARSGGGATLIEAVSYRLGDHTTADDASRYRPREELNDAWAREPVKRLREYLHRHGRWSTDDEQQLQEEAQHQVQAAVERYQATAPPGPTAMFDHLYATLPDALRGQYQHAATKQSNPS